MGQGFRVVQRFGWVCEFSSAVDMGRSRVIVRNSTLICCQRMGGVFVYVSACDVCLCVCVSRFCLPVSLSVFDVEA